jgi:hypothetical protein
MMRQFFVGVFMAASMLLSQQAAAQFYSSDGRDVLDELVAFARVKVSANGGVTFDEKSVTQEELEHALDRLKERNGAVLYYRENPGGVAPDSTMKPFRAILAAGLPVSLSTDPNFADYVDPQGNVRRRALSLQ